MRSVLFSGSGRRLYSCCSSGSLAAFDSKQQTCPLLRLLGNVVVRGEGLGEGSLALSEDDQRLAYVGPLKSTVTILDAFSLSEVRVNSTAWSEEPLWAICGPLHHNLI